MCEIKVLTKFNIRLSQYKWEANKGQTQKNILRDWHQLVATKLKADGSMNLFVPSNLPQRKQWPWQRLNGKMNSPTKVPVSALDCKTSEKDFFSIEAI